MNLDLPSLLVLVFLATGAVLLFDAAVLRPKRKAVAAGGASVEEPAVVSYARSLFPLLLIVLLFRAFVFEPFRIPSESMMPGLVDGDFIVVNKYAYGLRLPLLNLKIVPVGEPQRGDVVVFRAPSEPINLIKRVIGLPGDHIVVHDNRLLINGTLISLTPEGLYTGGYGFNGAILAKERFGNREHSIMLAPGRYPTDFDGVVPAGHYFFMGDNRNDSEDSRFAKVGFVSEDRLVGRAIRIWMNWQLPGWPQFRRIGMRIQ